MSHPYFHAVSSSRTHGGAPSQFIDLHSWFDDSKQHMADFRHRALRHHAQGVFWAEEVFGPTLPITTAFIGSDGARLKVTSDEDLETYREAGYEPIVKQVPTRIIGEQHVREDLGRIPMMEEWFGAIKPAPWMNRSRKLSRELEREGVTG